MEINNYINKFIHLDTIDSTNEFAKRFFKKLKNRTLILADEQTEGKGRFQRKWFSPKNEALYFSLILKRIRKIENLPFINLISALAIFDTIEEITGLKADLKWPNDVYINKKKLSGILIESIFKTMRLSGIIVGIGVNVNVKKFPEELCSKATSLYLELNKEVDKFLFLKFWIKNFFSYLRKIRNKDLIIKKWLENSSTIYDSPIIITIEETPAIAKTCGITSKGYLLVKKQNGSLLEITTNDFFFPD